MSKVTSKLQVSVPKAVATRLGIRPGDELEWVVTGNSIKVVPSTKMTRATAAERLERFDAATHRQQLRQQGGRGKQPPGKRGWTREELYDRGGTG